MMSDADTTRLPGGIAIPASLIQNVRTWNADELTPGWLENLPRNVAALCDKWQITLNPTLPVSTITLVVLGDSEILGPVVIKSSPLADEFRSEATALRIAGGGNVSKLHDVNFDQSIMVVEQIQPGTPLKHFNLDDDIATRLAAETVQTFWREVEDPTGLTSLRPWCRALLEWKSDERAIPDHLIARAQQVANRCLDNQTRFVLLHGDFHHDNLLRRGDNDWAIIDPKGLIGDPAFEVVTWMWNPMGIAKHPDYAAVLSRRIDIFSEVWGRERSTLVEWAFFGAVLSLCWYGHSQPSEGRDGMFHTVAAMESLLNAQQAG